MEDSGGIYAAFNIYSLGELWASYYNSGKTQFAWNASKDNGNIFLTVLLL